MSKQVVLDVDIMVKLFGMDGTSPWNLAKDYPNFSQEEVVKLLLLGQRNNMPFGKVLITSLSIEDRLLHFMIVKYIIPWSINERVVSY